MRRADLVTAGRDDGTISDDVVIRRADRGVTGADPGINRDEPGRELTDDRPQARR